MFDPYICESPRSPRTGTDPWSDIPLSPRVVVRKNSTLARAPDESADLLSTATEQIQSSSVLASTDVGRILLQFQNGDYLTQERTAEHLPALRQHIDTLRMQLNLSDISPDKKREMLARTHAALAAIDRVAVDKPAHQALLIKAAWTVFGIGLMVLPLLKTAKDRDYQYFSLLAANYFKTLMMLVGLGLNRTADSGSYGLNIKERQVPLLVSFAPYLLSEVLPPLKHFERAHPLAFNGVAAAFSAMTFLLMVAPQLLTKPARLAAHTLRRCSNAGAGIQEGAMAAVPDFSEEKLAISSAQQALRQRRVQFESQGKRLSDVLVTQMAGLDRSLTQLCDILPSRIPSSFSAAAAASDIESASDSDTSPVQSNPDFHKKLGFGILATSVCLASAATYYKEPMGLVGLTVRAGLVIAEMAKTVVNPSEPGSRAAEQFVNYSGLSLLLLPYGVVNDIPATHFTGTLPGLITGTVLLACANLTLPRPIAELLAGQLVKLMNRSAQHPSPLAVAAAQSPSAERLSNT